MIKTVPGRPRRRATTMTMTTTMVTATTEPRTPEAPRAAELSASGKTMTICAEEVAQKRSRLGGPGDALLAGGELVLVVDPDAVPVAEGLVPALEGEAAVQAATGVTPQRLRARLGQFRGLSRYLVSAEGLRSDVQDTRMALRSLGRRHRTALIARIQQRLSELSPGSAEYKRVSGNAKALLSLVSRPVEVRKETRKKNLVADRTVEIGLHDIAREKEMVQTLMALQAGEDVSPMQRAAAAETYATMGAAMGVPIAAAAKKGTRRARR